MSFLSNIFKKASKPVLNDPQYTRFIFDHLTSGSTLYNDENDETYIDKGYRSNAVVYSLVSLIARHASVVPYQIFEVKNKNEARKYKAMTSGIQTPETAFNAKIIKSKAFVELEDTDLHELLERPNPDQGYASFINNLVAFGKLTGNRYIQGISPLTGDNKGKVKEMHVLPSQCMTIISGGLLQPVKGYQLDYNTTQELKVEEVCHIKDFNPYYDGYGSHLYGQSPIRAAYRTLETNNEAVDTGRKMLMNQASRGILTPKEMGGVDQVQASQLDEAIRKKMYDTRGGISITNQPMEWINFGLSVTDLALIEQYNASVKDLCNVFGVPVRMLNNTDSSTFNNTKEDGKSLYQNAIVPELRKIRDELNRWLVKPYGENLYLDFDFSSIPELQQDMTALVTQLNTAYWVTPNEKREAMNYATVQDNEVMNDYLVPQGLTRMSDLEIGNIPNE